MLFICFATVAIVLHMYMHDDVLTFSSYSCALKMYMYNHKCERMLFSGGTLMYMYMYIGITSIYTIHATVCFAADLDK